MLFDLRSRGRRRTVQGVYLFLAIILGGGLVLFGVGAGNGLGGLLNAFTGNGSGNNQSQVVSAQEKTAQKAVNADPNSAAAWAQLLQARWSTASSSDYNQATNTFTAAGQKKLTQLTQDWQHYIALTKNPDPGTATLAARGYEHLGNYAGAASAWEAITLTQPTDSSAFQCLAANAYAAKQTRKGDLAMAKALSMAPKAQQATLKTEITSAKTTPTVAQSC
jgi:tetratricopeptide (TPR) repeat protein